MAADLVVDGVTITHPDRVFWPQAGLTKLDLVEYYRLVAPLMLPYVIGRPVSMVRCPGGLAELPPGVRRGTERVDACFFHKHPSADFPGPFERVMITDSGREAPYLTISEPASLTALAQMAVLEIHIWGSALPDLESPDLLVFDLDPDPALPWGALADGARYVRQTLEQTGLTSFVKTTGGKGLHVVAPIVPAGDWRQTHSFCQEVARTIAGREPARFTATMAKADRTGRIYVDYVRNTRSSTSIAPYSTRARDAATVAYPLRWAELERTERPAAHTLVTLRRRLSRLSGDPWQGYFEAARAQRLPGA
jgi:bifunctional non-homologous end joining protein LigD